MKKSSMQGSCSFLQRAKKIHKHQFGLQKGKSTKHALLDIYASILKALEKKQKACCIFIDFAKAFETVNLFIYLFFIFYFSLLMYNHAISSQLYYKYLQNLQRLHARYTQSAKTTELNLRNTARRTLG